jgi:hypothetical protein
MLHRLRVRRTRAADGAIDETPTVHCPVHDCAIGVDECMSCPERIGYKHDPSLGVAWIACRSHKR